MSTPPRDPLDEVTEEISDLRRRLRDAKVRKSVIERDRDKLPKLVRVSVSAGECGEEMLSAFAEACGWTVVPHDSDSGPYGWTYLCAQAWLFYEVTEKGVRLVGAWDQAAGSVGNIGEPDKATTIVAKGAA